MSASPEIMATDIMSLLDETSLNKALRDDKLRLQGLRDAVVSINDGLRELFLQGANTEKIVCGRARLIDRLLITLFEHFFANNDQPVSLIAVGGYGRAELHPSSDIDLMLLLDDSESEQTRTSIEQFLMLLWDSKLEIGHSVRTLSECVAESINDITVATNIMEARLLSGDADIFQRMREETAPGKTWNTQDFFTAKLEEQHQRNGKYNDTSYNLEPNIKASRGGLRDIQMIGWVAKRHFGADTLEDLVSHGFLKQYEYDTLIEGQQLLWRIRCSLHYLAGRREDRMLFDYQKSLAHEFGYKDDPENIIPNLAIESFMQKYFRTVMELERLNEMLLQLFREAILYSDQEPRIVTVNSDFQLHNNYIEARSEDTFNNNPSALLELFVLMQQMPEVQGVRASTIRLIRECNHLIDDDFRNNPANKRLFMRIMSSRRGITHELRRMNRYGLLAAYIPGFESITGRMQYDLFHAYTVDQHTLFVIRNLRRLAVPEYCHEYPLASGVFQHLEKPELLYLAGLFHDIAKGRNGDHSELGAVDALDFCESHDLPEADAQLVSWLVKNHLLMSITAQRRDISDPAIIHEFANKVGDLKHLDHLYLLTISDIRGTNPAQWNSWKDKLFIELYSKTANLLNRDRQQWANSQETIKYNRTDALRKLDRDGMHTRQVQAIWANFNDSYFLRHTASQVRRHTKLVYQRNSDMPLVHVHIDRSTLSLELLIYMPTRNNIFYGAVNTISQMNLNVINAYVMRCNDGHSLETFKVVSEYSDFKQMEIIAEELTTKLGELYCSDTDIITAGSWVPSRQQRHFDVESIITFETCDNEIHTRLHIETADTQGLLATIARVLVDMNISIFNAFVSSVGETAIDYFDITDGNTTSPLSSERQQELRDKLLKALQ